MSFLFSIFLSFTITLLIGLSAIKKKSVLASLPFGVFVLFEATWIFGFFMENQVESIEAKRAWDNFQFLGWIGGVFAQYWFYRIYTQKKVPTHYIKMAFFFTILSTVYAYLDPWLGGIRSNERLVPTPIGIDYLYDFGYGMWILSLFCFITYLYIISAFFWLWIQSSASVKKHFGIIFIGIAIPVFGMALSLLGWSISGQRDSSYIFFAISNSVIAWGLFKYRLFDLSPMAKDVLFDQLQVAVIILDQNQKILEVNSTCFHLGICQMSDIGKFIKDSQLKIFNNTSVLIDQNKDLHEILWNQRTYQVQISEVSTQESHSSTMCALYDVTELKSQQQKLKSRSKELEQLNSDLNSFSYTITHDLKAPLRAISGFINIINEDFPDEVKPMKNYLDRIENAAKIMYERIECVLDLARVREIPLQISTCNLSEIAEKVLLELKDQMKLPQLTWQIEPNLTIESDKRLMTALLDNLLNNAVKYSSKSANPTVFLTGHLQSDKIFFCIEDNGIGFDMQYAEKLFKAFERLHSDADYAGHGIGLATVWRIISRFNGSIWAKGELNQGAKFYVELPLKLDNLTS